MELHWNQKCPNCQKNFVFRAQETYLQEPNSCPHCSQLFVFDDEDRRKIQLALERLNSVNENF
jgi:DNA-directed RNA polymerase subunit RPC12/RpoP